jgi:phage gp36-like protein
MVKIHTTDLQKKLKSCANSPKQYTVKVKRSRYSSKIHRYALVKARVHDNAAVVTYDTLRDFVAKLPQETVSISIDHEGLHLTHKTGALLLRHIPGEWKDLEEVSIP